jgi:hypothetical protein
MDKEPTNLSFSRPPRFNVDCEGIDFETYQFLLQDIAQGIEDGNRMYGYGEPIYIAADGNFYPLSDNIIAEVKSSPKPIPKANPMPARPGSRRRRIELEDSGPLLEEVMLARGLLHAVKKRKEETG